MATVVGVTAARAQEIEDASLVSAEIVGNDLVFTKGDNSTVNAGRVIPPAISNWPVGSIFMNINPTNPSTLLGGGTWVRWGQGRVPVSVDETQTEFDVVEETGGAKKHKLIPSEMPIHAHSTADHTHGMSHGHGSAASSAVPYAYDAALRTVDGNGTENVSASPLIKHSGVNVQVYDFNGSTGGASATGSGNAGGDGEHNNLQPYITVYMWKRTA